MSERRESERCSREMDRVEERAERERGNQEQDRAVFSDPILHAKGGRVSSRLGPVLALCVCEVVSPEALPTGLMEVLYFLPRQSLITPLSSQWGRPVVGRTE